MKNIVLIGMPGAGKSTVGVILAKVLGLNFIDSDILIQEQEGKLLKDIIAKVGLEGYLAIENQVNKDISAESTVIATGGSVVYCQEAMEHFKRTSHVIYIKLSYKTILHRLGNFKQRGVVLKKGQTLKSLYDERCPLYEQYAHITIDSEGMGMEEIMEKIALKVREL
ncbi:shikimate kinase [Mobilitalea sibirica]|uniref:Shikimate kinase n=1 Tax=Mobilitalea sibirica TaxID=1462919 RepID=A0A8J7KVQ1_9FIRM|nr:shikimate kinase [Mobilitalea sibirica]MBH1940405.1 shikimate kinase [Mobilitalea sibirica]